MTKLSPINQKYIESAKARDFNPASSVVAPKINMQQPQDSVELSTKTPESKQDSNKNKKALFAGAIAFGALAVSALLLYKKINIDDLKQIQEKGKKIIEEGAQIVKEGENISQKGVQILEDGKKELDEVLSIIKEGKEQNFTTIFEDGKIKAYFESEGKNQILCELKDGEIFRKTQFNYAKPIDGKESAINIEEIIKFIKNGDEQEAIHFIYANNILYRFAEIKKGANDSKIIKNIFEFDNDKLIGFAKSPRKIGEEYFNEEIYRFNDNGLFQYENNSKSNSLNKTNSTGRTFAFSEGKTTGYMQNTHQTSDTFSCEQKFEFDKDNNIEAYTEGLETTLADDGVQKFKTKYIRKDDKLTKVEE